MNKHGHCDLCGREGVLHTVKVSRGGVEGETIKLCAICRKDRRTKLYQEHEARRRAYGELREG